MWNELMWPFAGMQQTVDLMNRQLLASQCRLLRDYLDELGPSARLSYDLELESFELAGCRAELINLKGSTSQSYLLYLHGGGFALGSLDTHRELVMAFARHADMRVLAVDYRLAPDDPWPAGLDDAVAAYDWLLQQQVNPARLVVAGDSAGGGLALALLQRLKREGKPLPAAGVLLSPWLDLTCSGDSVDMNAATDFVLNRVQMKAFAELYAGKEPLDSPNISPLFGDVTGLPPLLVQVSMQELLRDDALRLQQRIKAAGGQIEVREVAWMPHVWQLLHRYLPQAAASVRQASRFMRSHTLS